MLGAARVQAPVSTCVDEDQLPKSGKSSSSVNGHSIASSESVNTVAVKAKSSTKAAVLRLQLLPGDANTSQVLASFSLNPLLQLNVSGSYSLSSIAKSIAKNKWNQVPHADQLRLRPFDTRSTATSASYDCPANGWGIETNKLTLLEVFEKMGQPTPWQFTYTLPAQICKPTVVPVVTTSVVGTVKVPAKLTVSPASLHTLNKSSAALASPSSIASVIIPPTPAIAASLPSIPVTPSSSSIVGTALLSSKVNNWTPNIVKAPNSATSVYTNPAVAKPVKSLLPPSTIDIFAPLSKLLPPISTSPLSLSASASATSASVSSSFAAGVKRKAVSENFSDSSATATAGSSRPVKRTSSVGKLDLSDSHVQTVNQGLSHLYHDNSASSMTSSSQYDSTTTAVEIDESIPALPTASSSSSSAEFSVDFTSESISADASAPPAPSPVESLHTSAVAIDFSIASINAAAAMANSATTSSAYSSTYAPLIPSPESFAAELHPDLFLNSEQELAELDAMLGLPAAEAVNTSVDAHVHPSLHSTSLLSALHDDLPFPAAAIENDLSFTPKPANNENVTGLFSQQLQSTTLQLQTPLNSEATAQPRGSARKSLFLSFNQSSSHAVIGTGAASPSALQDAHRPQRNIQFSLSSSSSSSSAQFSSSQELSSSVCSQPSVVNSTAAATTSTTTRTPFGVLFANNSAATNSALNILNNPTNILHFPSSTPAATSAPRSPIRPSTLSNKENCAAAIPPTSSKVSPRRLTLMSLMSSDASSMAALHAINPTILPPSFTSQSHSMFSSVAASSSQSSSFHSPVSSAKARTDTAVTSTGKAKRTKKAGSGSSADSKQSSTRKRKSADESGVATSKKQKVKHKGETSPASSVGTGGSKQADKKKRKRSVEESAKDKKARKQAKRLAQAHASSTSAAAAATLSSSTSGGHGSLDDADVNWDEWAEELDKELSSDGSESANSPNTSSEPPSQQNSPQVQSGKHQMHSPCKRIEEEGEEEEEEIELESSATHTMGFTGNFSV